MNRLNFTTERLGKLTCPEGKDRIYYHDSRTRWLTVSVTTTGAKVFYICRRIKGRPKRVKLGIWPDELSVDGARTRAAEVNGDIARGVDPSEEGRAARQEMTFADLWTDWLEKYGKVHKRSFFVDERQVKAYLGKWTGRRLSEIGRGDVQTLHARMGRENGRYQANRTLSLLHTLFRWAQTHCKWRGDNPAQGIRRFQEQSRERFLAGEELSRFLAAVEEERQDLADFFLTALYTGARIGNVQAMRWDDLALERAEWRIPKTKTGEVRLALVPQALTILHRRLRDRDTASPYVFPGGQDGHIGYPRKPWLSIVARAGLKDLRIHDLRRTLGSWQAATGASLLTISKSLGHKDGSQATRVYARLTLDPVRESVTRAVAAMMLAAKKGETA